MSGWKILLTNFFSTLFSLLLRGRRHSHFSVSHALSLWNNKSSFLIILILCFFRFWWIIYQEWSRTDVTKLLNVFSYWTAVSESLINITIIIYYCFSLSLTQKFTIFCLYKRKWINRSFYDCSDYWENLYTFDKSPVTKTSKKNSSLSVWLSQFAVYSLTP